MDRVLPEAPPEWRYAAFISYSRAVDGRLAPALAQGLLRFAKPWYRRRALRIFRDDESLSANPGLWSSIQGALDGAEFFILLASPEAARSQWVEKEVAYWLDRRSSANLLIVVTDGAIVWNHEQGDFDGAATTCLPPALYGAFSEEPRWVDLRAARGEQHLSLRVPMFRDGVADLAAALHHLPKDEIIGEDLQQYRRTRQLVISAIALLAVVALFAAVAAVAAVNRARVADEQQRIADEQRRSAEDGQRSATARLLAAQATESVTRDPRTALRLALAAHHMSPGPESQANLYQTVTATAFAGALPGRSRVSGQAFFPDGEAFVATSDRRVAIWDIRSTPPTKLVSFATADLSVLSPDGRTLVTGELEGGGMGRTWLLWDVHDRAHPTQVGPPMEYSLSFPRCSHPTGIR